MDDASRIAREVWHEYAQRAPSPSRQHIGDLLAQEGFLDTRAPLIDVAAGPSPHVGWNLLTRLTGERDVCFTDWRADWLSVHKHVYHMIKNA